MIRAKEKWKMVAFLTVFLLVTPLTIFYVLDNVRTFDIRSRASYDWQQCEYSKADLNQDEKVNIIDFEIWIEYYGAYKRNPNNYAPKADLINSGTIEMADFGEWLRLWRLYKACQDGLDREDPSECLPGCYSSTTSPTSAPPPRMSGGVKWNDIQDPDDDHTLLMEEWETDWFWETGTFLSNWKDYLKDVNLYSFTTEEIDREKTDDGIGSLFNIHTETSSGINPLRIRVSEIAALLVDTVGNVGVGTTLPNTKLTVIGVGPGANPLRVKAGDIEGLAVDSKGNVGMGTIIPGTKLAVMGGNNINPQYPDGLVGRPVTASIDQNGSYSVSSNETLYISSARFTGNSVLLIDGLEMVESTGESNVFFPSPLLASSSLSTRGSKVNINGFLVKRGVTPVTITVRPPREGSDDPRDGSFILPPDKTFYMVSARFTGRAMLAIDGVEMVGSDMASNNFFPTPLFVSSIVSVWGTPVNINGYLTPDTGVGGP